MAGLIMNWARGELKRSSLSRKMKTMKQPMIVRSWTVFDPGSSSHYCCANHFG